MKYLLYSCFIIIALALSFSCGKSDKGSELDSLPTEIINDSLAGADTSKTVSDLPQKDTAMYGLEPIVDEEEPMTKEEVSAKATQNIENEINKNMNVGEVYDMNTVDTEAQYAGGPEAMINFINKNLKKQKGTGTVQLRVVVNTDGTVSDVQVERSVDANCNQEAKRVASMLKFSSPAKKHGKPVRSWYYLPITFL